MQTLKIKYTTEEQSSGLIREYRKQYSHVLHFAFNRWIDGFSRTEKELYVRKYNRKYEYKSLDDYENPVTTIQDIKDLQQLLAQSLINFVDDRNLSDIDEVSFYFDGGQDSVKAMNWYPASDSSISVIGLQEEKGNGMTARKLIGKFY